MGKECETILGHTVVEYVPIEWIRFTMFNTENRYARVPMLVFRLEQKDESFDRLIECINDFKGNATWCVFCNSHSRKENYILPVIELKELYQTGKEVLPDQKEFFGNKLEEICDKAINDISELTNHVKKWFSQ